MTTTGKDDDGRDDDLERLMRKVMRGKRRGARAGKGAPTATATATARAPATGTRPLPPGCRERDFTHSREAALLDMLEAAWVDPEAFRRALAAEVLAHGATRNQRALLVRACYRSDPTLAGLLDDLK